MSTDAQLARILPLVRDAQIIGLADGTHGTHEFFEIKQRLIPMLAPAAIAFEAPYAEWQGTVPEVFLPSADYWFWDAQEIVDTIEWARSNGIDVAGVDCVHPHPAIDMVLTYLGRVDPATKQAITSDYSCLSQYASNPWNYYYQVSSAGKAACRASIALARPLLESRRASYEAMTSFDSFERVLRAARVVEQGELALSTATYDNRDACMAENVAWLASRYPGRRIVVWGHNEHIGKTPYYNGAGRKSLGAFLADAYGPAYIAIASVAMQGSFWAYQTPSYAIAEQQLSAPDPDDLASFLARAGRKQMFVSVDGALPPFFSTPHAIRIGGSNGPASVIEDVHQRFDGVFYFETSTPSRLRHFPQLQH